jgi:hypothetical protein
MPDEKPRDWDKELAEVDRLLAKLPHADPTLGRHQKPAAPQPGARAPAALPPAAAGPATSGQRLGVWIRAGLGLVVGLAMTQWPYPNACGLRLGFYLVGVGTVLAAGIWGALSSWRHRMGTPHVLSIALIVWGAVLSAGVIVPRVGANSTATWFCP